MIQPRTQLTVADNSGAKILVVIGLGKGTGRRYSHLGDVVTCVVHGANPNSAVRDHEIVKVVLVRARKETKRSDGSYIRFSDNAGVVVDATNAPRGTRIFGPIAQELKAKGFNKIVSMAKEVY